jgi:hypothetical protein
MLGAWAWGGGGVGEDKCRRVSEEDARRAQCRGRAAGCGRRAAGGACSRLRKTNKRLNVYPAPATLITWLKKT